MIIVASGISASGKTTWTRSLGMGAVIEEHGPLPDAPGREAALGEPAEYWTARNTERWAKALAAEEACGLAICDSDPLKLHFHYALWQVGEGTRDQFDAMAQGARAAIVQHRLGFADVFYVSPRDPDDARVLRNNDPTRRRRNFERNAKLYEPLMAWYRALGDLLPGRIVFDLPDGWRPPELEQNPQRYDPELLDALIGRLAV
ncbi:MAG: hypothetical protein AAF559_09450 [Pseudomonadota bacterium]